MLNWIHCNEYIDGIDCDSNNIDLTVKAVQVLIGLRAPPTAMLGHIGGSMRSIVHSSFLSGFPTSITKPTRTKYLTYEQLGCSTHGDFVTDRYIGLHGTQPVKQVVWGIIAQLLV